MSGQYGTCRSPKCGARLLFVETERGKTMPLDAEPTPKGDFVLSKLVDGREVARRLSPLNVEDFSDGRPRYTSHFVTCTDPEQFRKRRG